MCENHQAVPVWIARQVAKAIIWVPNISRVVLREAKLLCVCEQACDGTVDHGIDRQRGCVCNGQRGDWSTLSARGRIGACCWALEGTSAIAGVTIADIVIVVGATIVGATIVRATTIGANAAVFVRAVITSAA